MLVIRFQHVGKKHQPSYRIVVGERRSKLNGPQREDLGWYDPKSKKSTINKERVLYWLGVGAQKSPTIHNLLISTGVITGDKVPAHRMKKVKAAEGGAAPVAGAAPAAEPAKKEAEPKAEAKPERKEEVKKEEKPAPAKPMPEAGKPAPEAGK